MKKNKKLVSVILPVYNGEKFLDNSIKSILNQNYKLIELIIINDNSSDNSWEVIKKYLTDRRVKYFELKKKSGIVKCLNFGIKKSSGFYIARMDADDYSFCSRVKEQVKFLDNNKNIDMVGSKAKYFGNINFFSKLVFLNYNYCKSQIIFKNPFIHSSILIKKNILIKLNLYKKFHKSEDYHLWSNLLEKHNAANINHSLIKYQIHSNQYGQNDQRKINSIMLVQKKWISKLINKFKKKDLLIHYEISVLNEKFENHKKFKKINTYLRWIGNLEKNNNIKKIFDRTAFSRIIYMYSILVCFSFSNYGIKTYKAYKSFPTSKNYTLVEIILFSFCLLKIKNFYLKKLAWYMTQYWLIK